MCKHKGGCWIVSLLVFIGGLNWGLIGVGSFLDGDWNLVNLLLGRWAVVENVVYVLVGLAALAMFFFFLTAKSCGCTGGGGGVCPNCGNSPCTCG